MIFEHVFGLESLLRIDGIDDHPHIANVLMPAAEQVIRDAVGAEWVSEHEGDPTVIQTFCVLVATWFHGPEGFGSLTPGANFLLSQLQARALESDAGG